MLNLSSPPSSGCFEINGGNTHTHTRACAHTHAHTHFSVAFSETDWCKKTEYRTSGNNRQAKTSDNWLGGVLGEGRGVWKTSLYFSQRRVLSLARSKAEHWPLWWEPFFTADAHEGRWQAMVSVSNGLWAVGRTLPPKCRPDMPGAPLSHVNAAAGQTFTPQVSS